MIRQAAFTLIEILVTIVVIGISATALLSVFGSMVAGSANPIIQQQATTIAEAYMEEIVLRAYSDPQLETGDAEAGETRPVYDDVDDYNSIAPDTTVRDQNNNPIGALSDYSVTVSVSDAMLNGVAAQRIDISVSHAAISPILLTGYRTSY